MISTYLLLLTSLISCTRAATQDPNQDPYLWLEEIESERALTWVKEHNSKSESLLKSDPLHASIEKDIRAILLAKDRIPYPALRDGWIYNFWQDEAHVRGIWRRARPAEYARKSPTWELILDLDELARTQNENWVWKGSTCLPPKQERCLLRFSRGGKDASVIREFDVTRRQFIADGFTLPEAKSRIGWKDLDTIFVATDFGEGSLTKSGYPRQVKLWKRGTPLTDAKLVFEGDESDVASAGYGVIRPEGAMSFVYRSKTFYTEQVFALGEDGSKRELPFPETADFQGLFQGQLMAILRKDWKVGPHTYRAGSLVGFDSRKLGLPAEELSIETVFSPDSKSSLLGVSLAKSHLYLSVLENVRGRLLRASRDGAGKWSLERMSLPDHGSASVADVDAFSDTVLTSFESFVIPPSIYLLEGRGSRPIKSIPDRFNPKGLVVEQHFAASKDGTKIPYFLVRAKKAPLNGTNPTLLYAYGGFENAMTPFYLGAVGKSWLERGGAYALANIRGGGEFGPAWHQAALQKNRQRAFDDFISVAEDLVARKITSSRHLGIMGGSNGGLLMGAAFTQRPDLFGAVVCQVPLLDMLRYHRLLAGHSWIAEYGDPDNPEAAEAIRKYSPYQNLRAGQKYPKIFFVTSTKDDRVHPGHARKMVARMEELGQEVLYFENIEGGHSAAANIEQRIKRSALEFSYLWRQLGGTSKK